MRVRTALIAIALLAVSAAAHAQDGTLERVNNLIATGRLTEARNTLAQWERTAGGPRGNATADDRARALFLSGVLSTDAESAEDAFVGVALTYPSSPVAPEALLRLGQSLYTRGESLRAIGYLDRLRYDYPAASQRETAMLWLARAQLAAGESAAACGTARESMLATRNENVRTLIAIERDRACTQSGGIAVHEDPLAPSGRVTYDRPAPDEPAAPTATATPTEVSATPAVPATPAMPVPTTPDSTPASPASVTPAAPPLPNLDVAVDPVPGQSAPERPPLGSATTDRAPRDTLSATGDAWTTQLPTQPAAQPRSDPRDARDPRDPRDEVRASDRAEFSVQTAAFSERRAAERIAAELRERGFDARIVTVPGSPYFRVRTGEYATSRDAAAAALRVRDAGFATLIVNDVRLERRP